ncbi:hypothetical protein AB9F45_39130, partial [Rhizobium leguminosarum]|uniref:hypothetical protein n=1 Tax=Rhizobium leguminosarum TaxID=384 RepID=UPI003F9998EA
VLVIIGILAAQDAVGDGLQPSEHFVAYRLAVDCVEDGICVNDKGERLSLELVYNAGNQTREQIAQVIQSQLKDVCIEIT